MKIQLMLLAALTLAGLGSRDTRYPQNADVPAESAIIKNHSSPIEPWFLDESELEEDLIEV